LDASGEPSIDYSYIYTPTGGYGKYFYQIIAKDARGSVSNSSIGNFNMAL
jgi:hypothetical protein